MERANVRLYENVSSALVFLASAVMYILTADSSVSYWDCPEYVTCASRLEVGHPPGNPVWMLAMRMATLFFPVAQHAMVINICSALFMALAAMFLCRIIFRMGIWITAGRDKRRMSAAVSAAVSAGGALCFAFCDSAWYSAVEAEVYAMSAFLTSLTIWLMLVCVESDDPMRRFRFLVFIAYITGLSLGVHQLNLLTIPVLALIYAFRFIKGKGAGWKTVGVVAASFVAVGLILTGVMHGTLTWAMTLELVTVNDWGWPYNSGVLIYPAMLLMALVVTLLCVAARRKYLTIFTLTLFLWLSGVFVFGGEIWKGSLVLSACVALLLVDKDPRDNLMVKGTVWSLGMLILGYSSFALILIRGTAAPPMNEGAPTGIFALASYIARDQYGSKPLLYGPTPYSRPMLEERWHEGDSVPDYSRYALERGRKEYFPWIKGGRLNHRSGLMTPADSTANLKVAGGKGRGYIIADYSFTRKMTPELDMLFPRITGNSKFDLESYEDWAGMTTDNMKKVTVTEVYDSMGRALGKKDISGNRVTATSLRPTYGQNLRYLLSYQIGYMYMRYLLWNFVGRQNDYPSTGEIDHGNFITGFSAVDDLMLGCQDLMPAEATVANKGRNVYYGIPFLIGIIGMVWMARRGRRGREAFAVTALFFIMTGVAIVVYLNQTPGEPRERDYSFLGSYMAFCIWIAFGLAAVCMMAMKWGLKRRLLKIFAVVIGAALPALMAAVNFDDHDRSRRDEPLRYSSALLEGLPPGIIFTQGDNFIFPLWYAQEVEGIGREHSVVDVSYFGLPGYVANILRQGDAGLRLTARAADIAYGAYAYTLIADDAGTQPVEAMEMLRELYASGEGTPVIRHRIVTLPGREPGDTLTIDLRKLAGGSRISFRKLMLLDVLATNAASGNPRPVYFLSPVASDFHSWLRPALRRLPHAMIYAPHMADSVHEALDARILRERLRRMAGSPSSTRYADPLLQDMRRRDRGELVMGASAMLGRGDTAGASEMVCGALRVYPFSETGAGSFTMADTTCHEGLEAVRLLMRIGESRADTALLRKVTSLADEILQEPLAWRRYYASLPPGRRGTISNRSLRLIYVIPELKRIRQRADSIIIEKSKQDKIQ